MAHTNSLPRVVQSWHPNAEAVPLARGRLRSTLDGWGMPGLADDAEIVLAELMTNAFEHVRPLGAEIEVSYGPSGDGGLRLEVLDGDAERWPRQRPPSDEDIRGRGLHIVETLTAGHWGAERCIGRGKVVWADIGGGEAR